MNKNYVAPAARIIGVGLCLGVVIFNVILNAL